MRNFLLALSFIAQGCQGPRLAAAAGFTPYNTSGNSTSVCKTGGGGSSVVCSGLGNTAAGFEAVVSGGGGNTATAANATISGGQVNTIGANCAEGTISGGGGNVCNQAVLSTGYETISGGAGNTVSANYATIPGGTNNRAAGIGSFAAGISAQANSDGSYVWQSTGPDGGAPAVVDNGVFTYNVFARAIYLSSGPVNITGGPLTVFGSSITAPTIVVSTLIIVGADNTGKTGGFIGVGTQTPGFMIDIQNANAGNSSGIKSRASSNSSANIFWQESFDSGGNTGGAVGNIIRGDFGRGTPTTVLPAQAGDIFLQLSARGAFSANPPATAMSASSQGTMFFSATENISTNTWGTQFQIQLSSAGTGLRNAYYTFSSSAGAMRISMLDNSSGYQTDFRSYFSTHTVLLATNRGDGDFIVRGSTSSPERISFGAPTDSLLLQPNGNIVAGSSLTVTGTAFLGWEMITNSCGAGVTTCNADCSAGKVLTGGGCTAGVGLSGDSPNNPGEWGCTALTVTTLTSYAFCQRVGN